MGDDLGSLLVEFKGDLSNLATSAKQAKEQIGGVAKTAESASGSFLGSIAHMGSSILDFGAKVGQTVFGVQQLAQTAIGLGQAMLDPNAQLEQAKVAFTSLFHSSKQAGDYLHQLQDFAAATPFEFPELEHDAQLMKAFQFQTKDIIPDLTNIGDAISALGGSAATVDQVVQVFGQMHASTHLQTQDLMQLTSVGINGFQILADQMHKPVTTIKDMVSNGLIPAKTGIDALMKGMHETFGGGMQAQSETFNGLLSTFKDNVRMAWVEFSGPLFDRAKQGLEKLGTLVSGKQFQDFAKTLGSDLNNALNDVVPLVSDLAGNIQDVAGWVEKFGSNVEDTVRKSGAFQAVLQTVKDILPHVEQFVENVADALQKKLLPPVLDLVKNFSTWIDKSGIAKDGMQLLGDVISKGADVVGGFVQKLSDLFSWLNQNKEASRLLKDAIVGIGVGLAGIKIVDFGKNFLKTLGDVKKNVTDTVDTIGKMKDKLGDVLDFFKSKFAPEAEKSLGSVATEADTTGTSVASIGTSAETSAGEVAAASAEEEGSLAAVNTEARAVDASLLAEGPAAAAGGAEAKAGLSPLVGTLGTIGMLLAGVVGNSMAFGNVRNNPTPQSAFASGGIMGELSYIISLGTPGGQLANLLNSLQQIWNVLNNSVSLSHALGIGIGPTKYDPGRPGGRGFASGGFVPLGQPFMFNEAGPEMGMATSSGVQIWSHSDSMNMLGGGGGGDEIHVHVHIGSDDVTDLIMEKAVSVARRRGRNRR